MKLITNRPARIAICALFLLTLTFYGCSDDKLKAVATNIDRVAILINDSREIRDELLAQGAIDRDDAYKVTVALYKINTVFKTFNAKARTYADAGELTMAGKADLEKLANDIAGAAQELISSGAIGVKNPEAQQKVNAAIGAIRQVALALVDSVKALKAKPPVQQAGMTPLGAVPLILLLLRQLMAVAKAESDRKGMTIAEIFESNQVKLETNDIALIQDLVMLAPGGEVSPEVQARLDALLVELQKQV